MASDNPQTSGATCAPGTLEEELHEIEREQEEVVDLEDKERELEELQARARHLANELRVAQTTRRRRAAERALPVVMPREPCAAAWADMTGDERVRTCGKCKARVYDLAGLEPSDARKLLTEREGELPTHVIGRVDGTVTVESCEAKRRRLSPMAIALSISGAAGLLATGLFIGYLAGQEPAREEVLTPTSAAAAVDVELLVEELVKERMREAEEARLRAEAAAAEAEKRLEQRAKPPSPPRAEPEADDAPPESHRRRRRSSRCGKRRHRLYDPWASPFFFFFESSHDPSCDDAS